MAPHGSTGCLDEVAVLDYLDGDEAARAPLDVHLAECAPCRLLLRLAAGHATSAGDAVPDTLEHAPTRVHDAALRSPRPVAPLGEGDRLGRYRIVAPLGAGGMGVVYTAHDPQLDRPIAIKLLHGPGREGAAEHLVREGRAIAKLAHPNVVTVYDLDEDHGRWFVAMELVEGSTLATWQRDAPRTPRELLAMYAAAGRGLAAAHAAGLVHRDFKPSNVLVGDDARPRVSDFGLAVTHDGAAGSSRSGGTIAYMAPEQFDGAGLDARADQFCFAVALYEALEGRRPFPGQRAPEIRAAIARGPLPMRARIPRQVIAALHRALSEQPAARFPAMAPLLRALEPARRRGWLVAALAGAVVAGGAAAVVAPRAPAALCTDLDLPLTGVWDPVRRAEVARAFQAIGGADADAAAQAVVAGLDRYAASWSAARLDTCQAARVRGEQTAEQQALRTICLDERLAELRAASELVIAADREVLANAHALLASLTPPEACADLATLAERLPVVGTAAEVATIQTLGGQLARARASIAAGRLAAAAEELAPLRPQIDATGYRPLQARAALVAGLLADRRGAPLEAGDHFRDAVLAAEAGRDNRMAAAAWLQLVHVRARGRGDLAGARDALAHATATVERLGADLDARAELAYARAVTLRDGGSYAEARVALEETVRLLARSRLDRRVELARVEVDLAGVLAVLGDDALARTTASAAIARARGVLGPAHPELAMVLLAAGALEVTQAEALLAEADRILIAAGETTHPRYAQLLMVRAHALISDERSGEALALLARALEIARASLGERHTLVAAIQRMSASAAGDAGDLPRARAALASATAIYDQLMGPASMEAVTTRVTALWLAYVAGDPGVEALARAGIAECERALGPAHPTTAIAWRTLALVLEERGRHDAAEDAWTRAGAIATEVGAVRAGAAYAAALGERLLARGKLAPAAEQLERALALEARAGRMHTRNARRARYALAETSRRLGRTAQSAEVLEALVAEMSADPAAAADPLLHRARLRLGLGLAAEHHVRARELIVTARRALGAAHPDDVRLADVWLRAHRP